MSEFANSALQPQSSRRASRRWWIIPVVLAVLLAVGSVVVGAWFFAMSLAWSGALRKDGELNRDQLPILSQTYAQHTEVVSVAVSDVDEFWAWGSSGIGTNSRVSVLTKHNGEGYWEWVGEVSDEQALLEVREPYRRVNTPPDNRKHNFREGADTLCYLPAKDCFLWSNHTSGRLLCSAPADVTSDRGGVLSTRQESYRKGKVLFHFERSPLCVAVSPDCKWIAVGLEGDRQYPDDKHGSSEKRAYGPLVLMQWTAEGCQVVHDLTGYACSVGACCFSPDGQYVVSGGNDAMVRVWSVTDGKLVEEWLAAAPVTEISTNANASNICYCSERGHIELRSRSGDLLTSFHDRVVEPPAGGIRHHFAVCATLSPDGKWVAVLSDGKLAVWQLDGNKVIARRELDGDSPESLVWSPAGKRLGVAMGDRAYMLGVELEH